MIRVTQFGPARGERGSPPRPARLSVPAGLTAATAAALREAGDAGREGLVLWAGRPDGSPVMTVSALIEPDVVGERDWMSVTAQGRLEVVAYLREDDLLVAADVHTHPAEAFLSPVDAAHPYSARPGHLAVVVPSFARGPVGAGWRAYELDGRRWLERRLEEVLRERGV